MGWHRRKDRERREAALRDAGLTAPEWQNLIAVGGPFHQIPLAVLFDECLILDETLNTWGLADSLSDARRLCKQGGIKINGIQNRDPKTVLGISHLGSFRDTLVIKITKGRKEAFWYIISDATPENLAALIGEPDPLVWKRNSHPQT